jgi:transcriptional regulator with XRE-family HTH domain
MAATSDESHLLGLADALREIRILRGMSKRALSQKAGLSASYVGKLEAGAIEPSVRAFAVIAVALNLTSHEVLFCVRCLLAEVRQSGAEETA